VKFNLCNPDAYVTTFTPCSRNYFEAFPIISKRLEAFLDNQICKTKTIADDEKWKQNEKEKPNKDKQIQQQLQGIQRRNLDMSNFHFRLWT
jgi:hypothetical protein